MARISDTVPGVEAVAIHPIDRTSGWRAIPAGVWALGFVSMFMDFSSEIIHALLPMYLVAVLGTSALTVGVIEGIAEAEKRARLLRDTTPLQRGIIRHLVLVLDMSFAMLEKDLLPSRYELAMAYARDFVREYFEQNPISQLAIVGMRDGVAVRISDMSGNPAEHLEKLQGWVKQEPQGNPSLQNALEMCRGALL